MSRGSFREEVMRAARELGGRQVSREALRVFLDMAGPGERKKLSTTISELVKEGRLERHENYAVSLIETEPGAPEKHEVMWRILRAKYLVTADNLAALAGVSRKYALEWLEGLIRLKLVTNITRAKRLGEAGSYRLIKDPGPEAPRNEGNAEKLRRLRLKKKEALDKLDMAFSAVVEARLAVSQLEEG